jgi:CheY-like chemotaxis protein
MMKILVVEDDFEWREALAMMYCRRLREVDLTQDAIPVKCKACSCAKKCVNLEPENNATLSPRNELVMTAADANQAIEKLQVSRSDLDAGKRNADLISLDLDIPGAGTGIDILKHATSGDRRVAVIGISAFRTDTNIQKRMGIAEIQRLWNLRQRLEQASGGRCEVIDKSTAYTVTENIKLIESSWSKADLIRLIRETDDFKKVDTADHLCLHIVLPDSELPDSFPDCVRIYSTTNGRFVVSGCDLQTLNQINCWTQFSACRDTQDMRSQFGTRLTYLAMQPDTQMFCSIQKADSASRPDASRRKTDWRGTARPMLLARLIAHRIVLDTSSSTGDARLLLTGGDKSVVDLLGKKWRNDGNIDTVEFSGGDSFVDFSPRNLRKRGFDNRTNDCRTGDQRHLKEVRQFVSSLTPNREDLIAEIVGDYRLRLHSTVFLQRKSAIGQDTRPARTTTLRDFET